MANSHLEDNKRIAKNTIMLYIRMLFGMLVSFYTSRVVLSTLGVEDFGIQNVVGGFVSMFSLISMSLSSSVQRFLTFELGKGDFEIALFDIRFVRFNPFKRACVRSVFFARK